MRQAIVTTYHGPTNTRGSRISAKCDAGRLSVPYDYALNVEDNHASAAQQLANRLGWGGHFVGGGLPNGKGYAFVDAEAVR